MEYGKLIKLLNEYEKDGLNEFETYVERWYCERTEQILSGKWENNDELKPCEIISKQYGFIKWLVDNDKIDFRKADADISKDIVLGREPDFADFMVYRRFLDEEKVLMILSIQENPIEFLISILK